MTTTPFFKMHGIGNDFMIIDMRKSLISLSTQQVISLATRKTGIGFDQLICLEAPKNSQNNCFMRIMNANGNEVENCGNAARCITAFLLKEKSQDKILLETKAGVFEGSLDKTSKLYQVILNEPIFEPLLIPLSRDMPAQPLDFTHNAILKNPYALSLGNPHLVFFVSDLSDIDLEAVGPILEHNILFPKGINVEIVEMLDAETLRMRVWERGVGITKACGTGACASVVAASLKGIINRKANVILDGGELHIDWLENNKIKMAGPASFVFEGKIDLKCFDK